MKLSSIRVDAVKIEGGAWVGNIPEFGAVRLKVRGFGSTEDKRVQKEATDAIPRNEKIGGITSEASDRIMSARLKAALMDWDGFIDEDNKPLGYEKTMADGMIDAPEFVRFRDAVAYAASIVGEQRAETKDETAKN